MVSLCCIYEVLPDPSTASGRTLAGTLKGTLGRKDATYFRRHFRNLREVFFKDHPARRHEDDDVDKRPVAVVVCECVRRLVLGGGFSQLVPRETNSEYHTQVSLINSNDVGY